MPGHTIDMNEPLTPEHFLAHVNKTLRVKGSEHALTLERVEQRRMEEWETSEGLRQPFNLIFRGPPGNVLREGLYTLEVEGGPAFELYVIPIHTPVRDRQNYQAAFNYRRASPQTCDGKMPCSAMQRQSARKGCMFRCGWLPPTLPIEDGDIATRPGSVP